MAYTTIDNGEEHFNTVLYTGNASARNITGVGFQPDWLWIKQRSGTTYHRLYDSTRGAGKEIYSNTTDVESNGSSDQMSAFISDGFSIPSSGGNYTNINTATYVAWNWKANGGTTSTNDASATSIGTIDSVIQANTTAGFSIVTWTGTGSAGTIAHGLGVAPSLYIIKNRERAESWRVASEEIGYGKQLLLNETDAESSDTNVFNNTAPTSTVFSIGTRNAVNNSGEGFVAYVFAEVKGYSKIGKYTGNGNNDGTFVYTGFKPAWLMVKKIAGNARAWVIHDNTQDPINPTANRFNANTSEANQSSGHFDFLSNGFKCYSTEGATNQDTHNFLYLAFAEHPFVSSKGVPVTAR